MRVGDQFAAGRVLNVGGNLDVEVALVLEVQLNAAATLVDQIGIGGVGGIDRHQVPELALTERAPVVSTLTTGPVSTWKVTSARLVPGSYSRETSLTVPVA